MRCMPRSEEARYQARVAKMRAGIVGRASAVGVVVLAVGFLAIGAVVEALEGLATATALFGIGCAGEAHTGDIKDGNRKAEQL